MAERRLGEALRQRVVEDAMPQPILGGEGESILMNPNRQRILEHLAFHPCSSLAQVAAALRMSGPTVQWHVAKLTRARYLRGLPSGRSQLYYPADLPLDAAETSILATVNGFGAGRLLALIAAHPGLTLRQLSEAAGVGVGAARLQSVRLASSDLAVVVTDGRYRRFYPGGALARLDRGARRKLRVFRARLLKRLEMERLRPRARPTLSREHEIELQVGDRAYVLRLPANSLLESVLPPEVPDA
jgi:DNA-binding transcriptional ArsR family regulator